MDYKEKYENGVNELRNLRNRLMELNVINADGIINANLERIFPELRESEDEKIRRAIINVFATHKGFEVFYGAAVNDILSWLKKQGEPKPAEVRTTGYWNVQDMEQEVKQIEEDISAEPGSIYSTVQKQADTPKFKVGDWCIESKYNTVFQITKVSRDTYTYRSNVGETYSCMHYSLEEVARLWTIQDAKDGDVLVAKIDKEPNDFIYIFYEYDENGFWSHCYLYAYINKFHEGIYHNNFNVGVPATKEQRDLLFTKMKEAGYEWDAEKKVLRKIKKSDSAWNEEDDSIVESILFWLKSVLNKLCYPRYEHWLESLKERMKGE